MVTPDEPALFTFIDGFIKNSPNRLNANSGKRIDHRTIQKYNTVFGRLKEFANGYSRRLDFDTIDLKFHDDFTRFLSTSKNFSTNNVGKYIQTLKTFLNEATVNGFITKMDYKSNRFKDFSGRVR